MAAASISPTIQIILEDSFGNIINTGAPATANVTLAIGTNPGSGSLSGTATLAASAGIASFSGLSISSEGNGYTLNASSSGVSTISTAFNISVAAANKLNGSLLNLVALQ